MHPFQIIALTPAGVADARLVLAADRAGCLGIINAEIGALPYAVLDTLRGRTREPFGLKLGALDDEILSSLECYVPAGLGWLVVDAAIVLGRPEVLQRMVGCGLRVIVEATEWDDRTRHSVWPPRPARERPRGRRPYWRRNILHSLAEDP